MIRDLKLSDLVILEENNNIPNLFNGPFKLIKSIEKNGELIGTFWARVTTETTLILRPKLSNLTIARAIDDTFKFLYYNIPSQLGISDSFIIFENDFDSSYVQFLKKHFNFEDMQKVLRLRRNDGQ